MSRTSQSPFLFALVKHQCRLYAREGFGGKEWRMGIPLLSEELQVGLFGGFFPIGQEGLRHCALTITQSFIVLHKCTQSTKVGVKPELPLMSPSSWTDPAPSTANVSTFLSTALSLSAMFA